jgi:hypothetical protein
MRMRIGKRDDRKLLFLLVLSSSSSTPDATFSHLFLKLPSPEHHHTVPLDSSLCLTPHSGIISLLVQEEKKMRSYDKRDASHH